MRVLMVSRGVISIGRRSGGAELVAFELARHLAHQEHQVTLIADVEQPMLDSVPRGLSVRCMENGRRYGRLVLLIPFTFPRWLAQHFVGNMRVARCAVATLEEDDARFDVVHTHGALATIMIGRAMRRSRMDTQLIYTEHDSTPWTCLPRGVMERLVRKTVYHSVNLRACRRASMVVTNFAELARELAERTGLPPGQFATVPNGADIERFSPDDDATGELVKLGSKRYCLYVGSLIDRKAPDLLLHALAKVELGLVVVGEGPMGRDLQRLARRLRIAHRVLFTGAQPQIAVRRYYQKAAFLVLPSFSEAVPLVVFEALSTGKPVVATELEGIASVVHHGENGLLVPPGDVEALSAALDLLANDDELYRRLASNAATSVRDRFSWDVIARQLHLLYAKDSGSDCEAGRAFPHCEEADMPVKVDSILAPILSSNAAAGPPVEGSMHV